MCWVCNQHSPRVFLSVCSYRCTCPRAYCVKQRIFTNMPTFVDRQKSNYLEKVVNGAQALYACRGRVWEGGIPPPTDMSLPQKRVWGTSPRKRPPPSYHTHISNHVPNLPPPRMYHAHVYALCKHHSPAGRISNHLHSHRTPHHQPWCLLVSHSVAPTRHHVTTVWSVLLLWRYKDADLHVYVTEAS